MFRRLISRLPENKAGSFSDELKKKYPGIKLIEVASDFKGVNDLVSDYFGKRVKSGTRLFLFVCRDIAGELHDRGEKYLRKSSNQFSSMSGTQFDKAHMALHPYVWDGELCEIVVRQAWGKIGKKRMEWIKSDERSATDQFGGDVRFLKLFVDCSMPLYSIAEEVDGPISGKILKLVE